MLRLLLSSIFITTFSLITMGQLSVSTESIESSLEVGVNKELTVYVTNNSSEAVDVQWTRTQDLPQLWSSWVCDKNLCYTASTSQEEFTLQAGEESYMKVTFSPTEVTGTGVVTLNLVDINDENNAVTINYTGTAFSVSNDDLARNPIHIYPNPATNHIALSDADGISSMEIYNVIGKKVRVMKNVRSSTPYDVSGLDSGIYLIRLLDRNGDEVVTKRISKR